MYLMASWPNGRYCHCACTLVLRKRFEVGKSYEVIVMRITEVPLVYLCLILQVWLCFFPFCEATRVARAPCVGMAPVLYEEMPCIEWHGVA